MRDADVLADDCEYFVGGEWKHGIVLCRAPRPAESRRRRAGVAAHHLELRVAFIDYCDPPAVADVRMAVRADPAGNWCIGSFDNGQMFRRG